jgi:hypothetical protein
MHMLLIFLFSFFDAHAQIRPLQTTRLISTSGAGVGSMLVAESAILNPAPIAFFQDTYVSYQRGTSTLGNASQDRLTQNHPFGGVNHSESYFLFDNSSSIKGGLSYQYQKEDEVMRRRLTATFSTLLSDKTALGILYKHTHDNIYQDNGNRHRLSHPFSVGFTHVFAPEFILGGVWEDPTRASLNESRILLGMQFNIFEKIVALVDVGADPRRDMNDSRIWKAALQVSLFSDVYLRAGRYQDRSAFLDGESWGLAWIGPKLGAEIANKRSYAITKKSSLLYEKENINDLSFAFHLRF